MQDVDLGLGACQAMGMGLFDPEENGWVRADDVEALKVTTEAALLKRLRQLRDAIEAAPQTGLSHADLGNVVQDMIDEVKATGTLGGDG